MASGLRWINISNILPIANYPQFILIQYQEAGQQPAQTATPDQSADALKAAGLCQLYICASGFVPAIYLCQLYI